MKKFILLVTFIFCITACSSGSITKIDYRDLNKKIEKKESFILLFNEGSDDGKLLKQTLETVLEKNDLNAFEINPKKLSDKEKNNLRPLISYQDVSIVFIKDGIDPSILSHVTSSLSTEEEITNRLTDMEYIKATN